VKGMVYNFIFALKSEKGQVVSQGRWTLWTRHFYLISCAGARSS
jgi:hypothetical protein